MKRMLPAFLVFGFLLTSFSTFAQITNYTTQQAELPCLNKEFSVVLHTVVDSLDNMRPDPTIIDLALAELNKAFEPICASFKICEERLVKNFQYDNIDSLQQWEEMLISEHQANRINVFLVNNTNLMQESPVEEGGFATQTGIQMLETGGIAIHKPTAVSPAYWVHLFGHYFGLVHTFEGNGTENVDGSNCDTEGDLICDTPADNYFPPATNNNPVDGGYLDAQTPCRYINGARDANGEPYRPDVGNYMSYYEPCRCAFSFEQFQLMVKNYLAGSPKMW